MPVGILPSWGTLEATPTPKVPKYPRQAPFYPSQSQPASSAEQVTQVPLPGDQALVPCGDTPPHPPTPSLSMFLASQIENRCRFNKENDTCPPHLLTPTLARPRETCGLLGHSEHGLSSQTHLEQPTPTSCSSSRGPNATCGFL